MSEISAEVLLDDCLRDYHEWSQDNNQAYDDYNKERAELLALFDSGQKAIAENKELKLDMADYSFIVEQVSKVYDHITNGKLSKANYPANVVIAISDDVDTETFEELLKDETEELEAKNTALKKYNTKLLNENIDLSNNCNALRQQIDANNRKYALEGQSMMEERDNIILTLKQQVEKGEKAITLVDTIISSTQDGCSVEEWDTIINPMLIRYVNEVYLSQEATK